MASTGDSWQQQDQPFNNMDQIGQEDFANLLDFEAFDFLTNFDPNAENAHKITNGIDLDLLANANANQAQHLVRDNQAHVQQGQNLFDIQMQIAYQNRNAYPISSQDGGHHLQQHPMVPPTPNSVEMHGDAARYLAQMDEQTKAILEHQYSMRKNDAMNFTPLGTPAVTPHDAQFNANPEYTVPGAYFSPLISPALEGQQHHLQHAPGSVGSTSSPNDVDINMLGEAAIPQPKPGRKSRRQSTNTRSTAAGRKVAQSPIQKPTQRRKAALSSVIPPKEVTELLEMHSQNRLSPTSPNIGRMSQRYPSSSDSISPEPLLDGLMGPPPKPHSAIQSPAMLANTRSPNMQANGADPTPATPASLMRIRSRDVLGDVSVPSTIHEQGDELPMLDDLTLPEAATTDLRSSMGKIDIAAANGDTTPKLSAQRGPRSAPLITGPISTQATPIASSAASPISAAASPVSARRPDLGRRLPSKKRGSVSSGQLVSPALRPKISPSIKPLLPDGATSESTEAAHALLLTNRSNYQNLIDGMNIPGVTFPSDLPSQLTSKRTSHKIAEQGRRQRINVALVEMQGLLPKSSPVIGDAAKAEDLPDEGDSDDDMSGTGNGKAGKKGKGAAGGGGNSKAATVESAIVYIRALQSEERRWVEERREREREVELLRKRIEDMERVIRERGEGEGEGEGVRDVKEGKEGS